MPALILTAAASAAEDNCVSRQITHSATLNESGTPKAVNCWNRLSINFAVNSANNVDYGYKGNQSDVGALSLPLIRQTLLLTVYNCRNLIKRLRVRRISCVRMKEEAAVGTNRFRAVRQQPASKTVNVTVGTHAEILRPDGETT